MYESPAFAHRLLRYVTDAAKQYARWRADFTGDPTARCDLFNDDIPLMSPESYAQFFLPYEQELSDLHGGVYYWHSCVEAPPSTPSLFGGEGTDSATMETGIVRREADGCANARDLGRQRARRGIARADGTPLTTG